MMGRADYFKFGDWNVECDVCAQKYKASELKLRWDGMRVCPRDWEMRHPQDFVKGVPDNQAPPWTRPEQSDTFVANIPIFTPGSGWSIGTNPVYLNCTPNGQTGVPGYGVPGCMIPRYISPLFVPNPPFGYPPPND